MSLPSTIINFINNLTTKIRSEISTHNNSGTAHSDIRNSIPTKTSQLQNNSGFITSSEVADNIDLTDYAKTADLAAVATSGSYNDLLASSKPSIPSANTTASNIKMNGANNSAGQLDTYARADHIHKSDSTKVDKVTGKSLVSDTEITKLSHVEDYATKNSAGTGLSNSSGALSVKYGTATGTACAGDDGRLSDDRNPLPHTHLLGDLSITSTLEGYENLNDFVTQGRYRCYATQSKTVQNIPFYNITFILEVISFNNSTLLQIIYTASSNDILIQTWYRVKSSGNWTNWKQLSGVERIYPKINPDGTGENNNLNNYINQGTYICFSTSDATDVQNTPVNTAFSLIVLPTAYSSTYYGCTQIVKTYNASGDNNNQIWTRNYYKSGSNTETWSEWECVSYDGHTHVKEDITNFSHQHNKTDINVVTIPKNADLNDDTYWNIGIYYIGSTNGGTISNRPEDLTGNFAFELEVCGHSNTLLQILKVLTSNNNAERIYYRAAKTGAGMSQWFRIANYEELTALNGSNLKLNGSSTVTIENSIGGKADRYHNHDKTDINFTAISSGDLNSFVTNGYYSCTSNASTSVTNKPAMFPSNGANFVLVVEEFGNRVFQTMEMISSGTANSRLYFRSKTSVGWSEWKECYSGQKAYYVATEEDPLDLNDFIEKGIFTFAKSGNVDGKLSNSPVFGYTLYVENQEYSAGNIIQIAKTITTNKNNNRIFYRVYTGSAWASNGEWNEIITNNKIDTALSSTSTNPVQNYVINTALNGKAPTDHKSTSASAYGAGTSSNYGHVKLSDAYTSNNGAASASVGASSKAVYDAYTKLNNDILDINRFNSNAQSVPITGGGWSGTIHFMRKNGWCLVFFNDLKKSSTSSSFEDIASISANNDTGLSIYSNYVVGNQIQDATRIRINENGMLQGVSLIANHAAYGFIMFPSSS